MNDVRIRSPCGSWKQDRGKFCALEISRDPATGFVKAAQREFDYLCKIWRTRKHPADRAMAIMNTFNVHWVGGKSERDHMHVVLRATAHDALSYPKRANDAAHRCRTRPRSALGSPL